MGLSGEERLRLICFSQNKGVEFDTFKQTIPTTQWGLFIYLDIKFNYFSS